MLVRGGTLSALCTKELHLSFLHGLTAFQKRFIQGQIEISVIANHRDQEKWGAVSLWAGTSHFLGNRRSCFGRGHNLGYCRTPQSRGSLGCISTRHVLWDFSGCGQIPRAYRFASLQVGEPPFMIKAEKLSLLGPNSSLSKADISNKSDELCCGIAYFSFPTIRGVQTASSAEDSCAGAAEMQQRRIPALACSGAIPPCLPTAPRALCWLCTHSTPLLRHTGGGAPQEQQTSCLVGSRW